MLTGSCHQIQSTPCGDAGASERARSPRQPFKATFTEGSLRSQFCQNLLCSASEWIRFLILHLPVSSLITLVPQQSTSNTVRWVQLARALSRMFPLSNVPSTAPLPGSLAFYSFCCVRVKFLLFHCKVPIQILKIVNRLLLLLLLRRSLIVSNHYWIVSLTSIMIGIIF